MIVIGKGIVLPEREIEIQAVRSQGAGGQNVNKVATAAHLRFDIGGSSLPDAVKQRLLRLSDQRISKDGVVVIKSQAHRSLEQNKAEALKRLKQLIRQALKTKPRRIPTRPPKKAREKRLQTKRMQGGRKKLRKPVDPNGGQ